MSCAHFALFLGVISSSAHAQETDLTGLWKATRVFATDGRGPLVVTKQSGSYSADFLGRQHVMAIEHGELSFTLRGQRGVFRGKFVGRNISGHWFPPISPTGLRLATPVVLRPEGNARWRGEVRQAEDEFTFYLLLRRANDGSLTAFLRNPQRDQGTLWGVERLVRKGDDVKLLGRRRGETEDRDISVGRYDPGNDVITLPFPSRGGSFDFQRDDDASAFYPRDKSPATYRYLAAPLARDDGWPTATPEDVGIDRSAIEQLVQRLVNIPMESPHNLQLDGLLIARHGKLVLEEYFHGWNRDRIHDTRSAAKSMTATIVGAAIQSGAPLKLASSVYELMNGGVVPADLESRKRAMTVENLLTMASGYFCDDRNPDAPGNESKVTNQSAEPDFYRITLALPMAYQPGDTAIYCGMSANLALGVVGRVLGESPLYAFDRLVGTPMQIYWYGWGLDPADHPYGGGGARFLPRDFMKMGQMMLDGGVWRGHRIVSADFVKRALAPKYKLEGKTYGYLWWGFDYAYNGKMLKVHAALGNGGQNIFVVPELDLVVAAYASNFGDRVMFEIGNDVVQKQILPAVLR
jgi:CubicO group peptidase (beta-lactamase class C family)